MPTFGLHVLQRVVEDREVAQAEEVHLDQAERLAARVVELRDDLPVLLPAHDRDQVEQRGAGHDDAGGVDAPLALEVLQAARPVDDAAGLGVRGVEGAELAGLGVALVLGVEDPGQRDVLAHDAGRHGLGQPLPHGEGVAHDAGGVLEGLLGLDGAVGDDHGHAVVAVPVGDVADDLGAAALVEVDVEVGHRHALGVEEPLEDQPVLQRVEVRDAHGVRAHRPGARAAARSDPDAVALGPADEVGDDEEVARVALGDDDAGLVLGLRADRVRDALGVARLQAPLDLLDEPGRLVLALGAREAGHVAALALGEADVAPLGDEQGVVAGLGQLAEQVPHLGRRLEVVAVAVELEPLGVVEPGAGLHAQQDLVRGGVGLGRVVQVVGGHERQVEVARDAQQVLADPPLDVQAVVHELAEHVARAEQVLELGGRTTGLVVLAEPQPGLHLAGRAAGRRDEAVVVALEDLPVHARLEVEALEAREAGEAEQVVHALRGLGQQGHVGVRAGPRDVVARACCSRRPT